MSALKEYIIAVDAMGGDNAPEAVVKGAVEALRKLSDVRVLLAGDAGRIESLLEGADDVRARVEIIDAPEVIGMEEAPMMAVRRKLNSSMVQAAMAVREKRAHAMVSAGSTGAVLACGMLRIGRIHGIERPALAPVIPGKNKPFLLIDCGANVDCQPKYLEQFGLMGSVYMQSVLGVEKPSVGLANIGAEEEKGNKLSREAYQLMSRQTSYAFAGNAEARDIPTGDYDVVVADGFDGNIILKYTEGIISALMSMLKQEMTANLRSKLGAALLLPALRNFRNRMSYHAYGGAPLLGVEGAVVKAHGSSDSEAIMNAVRQARTMVEGDVVGKITKGLAGLQTQEKGE